MKDWSPYTLVLFAGLVFLAFSSNLGWTYDPLRPQDSPRNAVAKLEALEERNFEGDPRLSDERIDHILYGDARGGGHHHSANRPCKTEFPKTWDEDKIISTVRQLAANDNAPWRKEENGYYVAEQNYEDLVIRVVLDEEGDDIITAYPTNLEPNDCYR